MFPDLSSKYSERILEERATIAAHGSFRDKVRYDLIPRPMYAFGLLAAADVARFCGARRITAIEFGVAEGDGLLNLCGLAAAVTEETGVSIEIAGFDTGEGLPPLSDYRDHPEIWTGGDFKIADRQRLLSGLTPNARMVWGDIAQTLPTFIRSLPADAPVAFVSVDLDIYTSTMSALRLFTAEAEKLLPAIVTYFDDTLGGAARIGSIFRNRWAGQLLAIDEFNAANDKRKIDVMRTIKFRRPLDREQWLEQMYAIHVLDHPARNRTNVRAPLTMVEHGSSASLGWPL
jgi:hypothetical protein